MSRAALSAVTPTRDPARPAGDGGFGGHQVGVQEAGSALVRQSEGGATYTGCARDARGRRSRPAWQLPAQPAARSLAHPHTPPATTRRLPAAPPPPRARLSALAPRRPAPRCTPPHPRPQAPRQEPRQRGRDARVPARQRRVRAAAEPQPVGRRPGQCAVGAWAGAGGWGGGGVGLVFARHLGRAPGLRDTATAAPAAARLPPAPAVLTPTHTRCLPHQVDPEGFDFADLFEEMGLRIDPIVLL